MTMSPIDVCSIPRLWSILCVITATAFVLTSAANNNESASVDDEIWHYPFSLRVHHNYSTTSSDFKPDFEHNARHRTFAKNFPLFRLRRQAGAGTRKNPEEIVADFVYEGDIIGRDPFANEEDLSGNALSAVKDPFKRWPIGPNGIVEIPYEFDTQRRFRDREKQAILNAMKEFEQVCVRWRERTANDKVYVRVSYFQQGCAATIGVRKTVQNSLLYRNDCFVKKGKLLHEMMHILGFYHEQSRSDRDSYVKINLDNVIPEQRNQFKLYSPAEIDNLDFQYDYGSLMHYPTNGFAIINEIPTIEVPEDILKKLGEDGIGQREKFSPSDLGKLRALTKCKILTCEAQKQFKCADNTKCISSTQKCDGTTDCPDGSDEAGCPKRCHAEQFACPNGKCIPKSWYCDGTRDCSDGSDEPASGCPQTCTSKQFRCKKDNICIELFKKCNGHWDCSDGEDESNANCPKPPLQPRSARDPMETTYTDPCSIPQYYQQYYQYCAFNYQQRIFYQQNPYFNFGTSFLGFDAIEKGVNSACGLPLQAIDNKLVNIDFDYIMQHKLCNNLIIHNAFIKSDPTTNSIQITLPSSVEKFIHSLRTKVKATQAKPDAPRKMEIYLSFGGLGKTRALSDWVRQGPTQTERFANATRAYARKLDVDGIVLDWRSSEIGPLFTLVKQLEKAVRTDPAKSPKVIDLQMGVIISDGLVKAQNHNKVMLSDLTNAVDYIMYISSTFGDRSDYNHLEPNNKLFTDTLQNGLPLQPGGPRGLPRDITRLTQKIFLPLNLGAKFFESNPDEPNSFDSYASGPAFEGIISADAGRLSAGEACEKFDKPASAYKQEVRELFVGEQLLHEPVAFQESKKFASYETPCSIAEKITFFNKKKQMSDDKRAGFYAGFYVPDISLDDTKGSCAANAVRLSMLGVASLANSPTEISAAMEECAKNGKDYSWKKPLSALLRSSLK